MRRFAGRLTLWACATVLLATAGVGSLLLATLARYDGEIRLAGPGAPIEIARDELERALNPAMAAQFTSIFKPLGFKFVTLDLEGFRSGSMNSLLPAEQLAKHKER